MSVKKYIAEKFSVPTVRGIKSVFKTLGCFQNTSTTQGFATNSRLLCALSSFLRLLLSFKGFIVLATLSAFPRVKMFWKQYFPQGKIQIINF